MSDGLFCIPTFNLHAAIALKLVGKTWRTAGGIYNHSPDVTPICFICFICFALFAYKTTLSTHCGNYMVYHKNALCDKTLHQQHMFSFFQITIHSQKQLPPIHSQTFLRFIPASSSLHPLYAGKEHFTDMGMKWNIIGLLVFAFPPTQPFLHGTRPFQ